MKNVAVRATVLDNVLLGSNPHADGTEGWPWLADRTWDVRRERRDGPADWSLACHHSSAERVGPGTVGWIHRWNGRGLGELAAVIVFDAFPEPKDEARGTVHYARGHLVLLERPVAGETIVAGGNWSGTAPYNRNAARQFASGVRLSDDDAAVLLASLDDADRSLVTDAMAGPGAGWSFGDPGALRRGATRLGLRRPAGERPVSAPARDRRRSRRWG